MFCDKTSDFPFTIRTSKKGVGGGIFFPKTEKEQTV